MAKRSKKTEIVQRPEPDYGDLVTGISDLLEHARRMSARSVNSILTATYWEIGRRIVEYEQGGKARAEYGEGLWKRLAADLTAKHGRGFSKSNSGVDAGLLPGLGDFPDAIWKIGGRVPSCPRKGGFRGTARFAQTPSWNQILPDSPEPANSAVRDCPATNRFVIGAFSRSPGPTTSG